MKYILKDDQNAQSYMLKQLLTAYTDYNIEHEMLKLVTNNYKKPVEHKNYKDYGEGLHAVSHIYSLINCTHPLVFEELKHFFSAGMSSDQYRAATKLSIAHEFAIVSDIPASEIKALGEVYEDIM